MSLLPEPQRIPLCERPTVKEFQRAFLERRAPVVLRGCLREWPALRRWSPEWLRSQFGAMEISTYAIRKGEVTFDRKAGLMPAKMSLAAFLDDMAQEEPRARLRSRLASELPQLLQDVVVPQYCAGGTGLETNLWISAPKTMTRLHFDQPHNLFAHIYGRKRVVLFSPDQTKLLYPNALWSPTGQFSRVQWQVPDLTAFPRLRETRPLGFDLEPGDLLFIPSGWWHYLDSDETTISVNFWWWPWWRAPIIFASALHRQLRGITR